MTQFTNDNILHKQNISDKLVHQEMTPVSDFHFFALEGFNQYCAVNGKENWPRFWSKSWSNDIILSQIVFSKT